MRARLAASVTLQLRFLHPQSDNAHVGTAADDTGTVVTLVTFAS
jgi:hypothetical protein